MKFDIFAPPGAGPALRRTLIAGVAILAAAGLFAAGILVGVHWQPGRPSFHDTRVNHTGDLMSLVDPDDPTVQALAERLGTPEAAYAYVRDLVRYAPMSPAASPGEIIRVKSTSCLGKATLLCSLYRAMEIPADNVRVITGDVLLPQGSADHAWIDLEYQGACLQQDPSGLLGEFGFSQFAGQGFTRAFAGEEEFCFNDRGFAVVSQLNRFKSGFPRMSGAVR